MPLNRKKPMYQPWNEEEFIADQVVQSMNNVERWMYRTLLQQAFFCSTRPYLPNDHEQLWRLAGCANRKQWDKCNSLVLTKFSKIQRRGQDLLKQKRLELDWRRERDYRKKLATNGHKGGTATQARLKHDVGQGLSTELNRTGPNRTEQNNTEQTEPHVPAKADESVKNKIADDARKVIAEIAFISQNAVVPDNKQSLIITGWLNDYTPDEIINAFRDFYGQVSNDDFQLKFASKNFAEKGVFMIETARRNQIEAKRQEARMERMRQQMDKEAAELGAETDRLVAERENGVIEENFDHI
jgi:uncharacterized protein YdaU (DUF1376 family)